MFLENLPQLFIRDIDVLLADRAFRFRGVFRVGFALALFAFLARRLAEGVRGDQQCNEAHEQRQRQQSGDNDWFLTAMKKQDGLRHVPRAVGELATSRKTSKNGTRRVPDTYGS